jgi:hypothetical protein
MLQKQQRRNYGRFRAPYVPMPYSDKKMVKTGAIIALLGFLIIVILRIVFGPTIYLGCG